MAKLFTSRLEEQGIKFIRPVKGWIDGEILWEEVKSIDVHKKITQVFRTQRKKNKDKMTPTSLGGDSSNFNDDSYDNQMDGENDGTGEKEKIERQDSLTGGNFTYDDNDDSYDNPMDGENDDTMVFTS